MRIIGIDTATGMRGIAIIDGQDILIEKRINISGLSYDILMRYIDEAFRTVLISPKDIDGIAVSTGPGSFTGIRVGIALAKGLSLSLNIPIMTFSALELLASNLPFSRYPIRPVIDAKRRDVYTALFKSDKNGIIRRIDDDMNISIDEVVKRSGESTLFVGDGIFLYKRFLSEQLGENALFPPENLIFSSAANLARLGIRDLTEGNTSPHPIIPKYLKRSYAEMNITSKD